MKSVGTRNTGPELLVRQMLHRLGYRFRLHKKDLPGKPDIVLPGRKKLVFVHGCFWHGHDCNKGRLPKSRTEYWGAKVKSNQDRDARVVENLRSEGWKTLTLWQCELKNSVTLERKLQNFLGPPGVVGV